jgi:hypothetical protein
LIAFIDHPGRRDDGGSVVIVDMTGNQKTLSGGWETAYGLAWSPAGDEVWFTTARVGLGRFLYAVSLSGRERLLAREPGTLTLQDVGRDGRILLTRDVLRSGILGRTEGDTKERDLSWLDWSTPQDLSADGKTLIFTPRPARVAAKTTLPTFAKPMGRRRSGSGKGTVLHSRRTASGLFLVFRVPPYSCQSYPREREKPGR